MASRDLFFQSFLLFILFSFCVSDDTLQATQMIKDGNFLISKENTFALGFFSPGSSSYRYLGIWFHKIPEQTVVWVANRNFPIHGFSGILSINPHGNLAIHADHEQKLQVWSTNVSVEATESCTAQLLDSGNLVLVQGRSKRIVWQSFDYPTDTIIKGMKLGINWRQGLDWSLTSWRSADDPGTGNYSAKVETSGSPQYFIYNGDKRRWRSVSWPWPWKTLPNLSNYSFVNNQDEIYFTFSGDLNSSIVRIRMDYSGLIKWSIWHEGDGQWKEFWSAPKSLCDFYGYCGAYSNCYLSNGLTFECSCLPGYEPKSPRDWRLRDGSGGCVRKRLESSSLCGNGEGFVKVEHVKLPDSSAAVWVDMSMSRSDCEQECKRNCSCAAYASIPIAGKGMGCLAWYGALIDTINFEDQSKNDLYVRVDALELAELARSSKGFLETKGMVAILVFSSVSAWFVISIFVYLWLYNRRKGTTRETRNKRLVYSIDTLPEDGLSGIESHPHLEFFCFSAILHATNNFSPANILGQGGFGPVYKGLLPNGQEVAVKRLSKNSRQGVEEFKNEVMLIAKLQHRNLVKLLGCCIEKEEQMLVYEYLPNKSLDSFLFATFY
uniref:Non-specific serine/threonine protein kinase n=1 Tax=Manihot esculenta TaxID=3983 RepID=A0A2C9U801_MANES